MTQSSHRITDSMTHPPSFLSLLAELRNEVYSNLINAMQRPNGSPFVYLNQLLESFSHPDDIKTLLNTSIQIRHEILPMLLARLSLNLVFPAATDVDDDFNTHLFNPKTFSMLEKEGSNVDVIKQLNLHVGVRKCARTPGKAPASYLACVFIKILNGGEVWIRCGMSPFNIPEIGGQAMAEMKEVLQDLMKDRNRGRSGLGLNDIESIRRVLDRHYPNMPQCL